MSEINTPHDRYFKRMFSRTELAAEFFEQFLPANVAARLDLRSLRLSSASYVDPTLREHISDLVFEAPWVSAANEPAVTAVIYVLLEHKSYVDPHTPFQLLRSLTALWDQQYKAGASWLPVTIPVVVYHGKEAWSEPNELAALFGPTPSSELHNWLPTLPFLLVDLRSMSTDFIPASLLLKAVLQTLRDVFADDLPRRLPAILGLLAAHPVADQLEIIQSTLLYLTKATPLTETDVIDALLANTNEKDTIMQTLADRWMEEGKLVGMVAGKLELLTSLIQRRLGAIDAQSATRLDNLSSQQLDELGAALFDFKNLAELADWLDQQV